jgi:hypothetical protein
MSVDLIVTALDLDRFRAAQGSRDVALLRHVLAAKETDIAKHDEYFQDEDTTGRYQPLGTAIQQIIYGTIDENLEPLFQFEHGAATIADVMGEVLDSDVLVEAKEDFWREVNILIRECRKASNHTAAGWPTLDAVLSRGPVLDVPLARLRLGTGHMTRREVRNVTALMPDRVEIPAAAAKRLTWPDQALEAVQGYRDWIRIAADRGLGLFFHH